MEDCKNRWALVARSSLLLMLPISVSAQSGEISGRIVVEKTESAVVDAEIEVRPNGRTARSDSSGHFRITNVLAGEYVILVRAIGFVPLTANLKLGERQVFDADFILERRVQTLSTVDVLATGGLERARLSEFESRRVLGFGHFIDRSIFERSSARQVDILLISRIPGLRTNRVAGKTVLASQRDAKPCYPQIVVNGISVFNGVPGGSASAKSAREVLMFDVNSLQADDILAFEWHNPSSTPPSYNATGAGGDGSACGTAIFWTK